MPFSSVQVGWRTHVSTWTRFFLGTRLGPYHEMDRPIVSAMLKLAQVKKEDHVCDIGCGDARVVITAAREYGTKCTGVELDKTVAELARKNVTKAGLDSEITIVEGDARKADISKMSVISLYLSERGNAALLPILNPHLLSRPSTRVVSFLFPMPTWTPVKTELTAQSNIPMYLYSGTSLPEKMRREYEEKMRKIKEQQQTNATKQ